MSSVPAREIISSMEEFAPLELAESWDNIGLMTGTPEAEITKAMLTLDVTLEVVEEAVREGCQMLLAHHPLLFKAVKTIDLQRAEGACLAAVLKHDLVVYAAHTNLDYAEQGINERLFQIAVEALGAGGLSLQEYAQKIKESLAARAVMVLPARKGPGAVYRVMTACGAFDGDIARVLDCKADTLLVGEIKYHDALDLSENGVSVLAAGHYDTEKIILPILQTYLSQRHPNVSFCLTTRAFDVSIV